ncbi:aspartate-semialdehyde dehydrogenase [Halovulum dunhuangense]|uniref:Aspartate-semialdehyde dehydrogenase n=1 Tax=Halovulum dunhuangense TaxID=1505036 RepID=A0A849KWI6_9RHOB|nr:usg protein [Halovulum dunhuangense]NNU79615.1 aspartate-semialdehyde dehydrogenase [Halovulum dunhuangense]
MRTGSITENMLLGHGLTTAEILYWMPDHQQVLQSFTWQEYDKAPEFPRLHRFIDFWREELEGPLHSVRYSHQHLVRPGEWRKVDGVILLN